MNAIEVIEQLVLKPDGFENIADFYASVAAVDRSNGRKSRAFKKWQSKDGTKNGLLKLKRKAGLQ